TRARYRGRPSRLRGWLPEHSPERGDTYEVGVSSRPCRRHSAVRHGVPLGSTDRGGGRGRYHHRPLDAAWTRGTNGHVAGDSNALRTHLCAPRRTLAAVVHSTDRD